MRNFMEGKFLWMAVFLFALSTYSGAWGNRAPKGKGGMVTFNKTIVALGDSLTEGYGVKEKEAYPARLEKKLDAAGCRWRVVNAGISGETSDGTLERLDRVLNLNPSIVILEIGVNDGFRGVDPKTIQGNIEKIVHILKDRNITVVLAGMRMFDDIKRDYNSSFAGIYPEVAKKYGLILIPHFLEGVAGDPLLNRLDGIHPNTKGYRIVADTIFPYIKNVVELKEMERK
jgi:acyl-CoA thioesterase-1